MVGMKKTQEKAAILQGDLQALIKIAIAHFEQGNYREGEKIYRRMLRLADKQGQQTPALAEDLYKLALFFVFHEKYAVKAEPLYRWAIQIWDQGGVESPKGIYRDQQRHAEAQMVSDREKLLPDPFQHEYAKNSKSANTWRAYRSDLRDFAAWCAAHSLVSLPATPASVAAYLADLAARRKVSTVQRRLFSISQAHAAAGHETPTRSAVVRQTMQGIKRTHAPAQGVRKV